MREKPIKVDEETDRLVSELAYLLGCTKKSVVREAVAELAQARRSALTRAPERIGAAEGPAGAHTAASDVVDGARTPPFDELPLRERLALRRSELSREFERNGATSLRLLGPLAEGSDAEEVELVAETDLLDGSSAVPKLEGVARRILSAPVHVTSTTALGLFDPDGLARTLSASRPL